MKNVKNYFRIFLGAHRETSVKRTQANKTVQRPREGAVLGVPRKYRKCLEN